MANQDEYGDATNDSRYDPGYVSTFSGPLETVNVTPPARIPYSPNMPAASAQPNILPWLIGGGLLVVLLAAGRR